MHGPAVSCEEYKEAIRAAPSGEGGTAAPIIEAARELEAADASACIDAGGEVTAARRVRVTFGPTGKVTAVLDRGPAAQAAVDACVLRAFQTITVPSYRGAPFSLRRESVRFVGRRFLP